MSSNFSFLKKEFPLLHTIGVSAESYLHADPVDPTDEPASVLLEKIKSATTAVKGGRKSKTGQTALAFMVE